MRSYDSTIANLLRRHHIDPESQYAMRDAANTLGLSPMFGHADRDGAAHEWVRLHHRGDVRGEGAGSDGPRAFAAALADFLERQRG